MNAHTLNEQLQQPIFQKLGELAEEAHVPIYVIGGFVRDVLLNRISKDKDIDILVVGDGLNFAQLVGEKLNSRVSVYKNFGTASLSYQNSKIEFVGARKESYRFNSRKPEIQVGTLQDDQQRRDFTINAMAISLNISTFGKFLDPFGGLQDLEAKLIRTPLDPSLTFSDDPLRMIRAIRLASQLNFSITPDLLDAIAANKNRIKIVSMERISDELNKIILSEKPSIGFKHLFNTGLLHLIFPQLAALQGVEVIEGKGHKDNFYHTLQVVDNIAKVSDDLWLRWAALLHDIAKPETKYFDHKQGWTFHGHEERGARMVPRIMAHLKLPLHEKLKFVQKMVQLHLRPIVLAQNTVTDSAVRRLLFEAGQDIDSLMLLCQADITTKNEYKVRKYRQNFDLVKQKLKDVEERDQIRNWQPPITGMDIMNTFGIPSGKEVGLIKNQIREAILEGEIINSREEAMRYMLKKGQELGLKPIQNIGI